MTSDNIDCDIRHTTDILHLTEHFSQIVEFAQRPPAGVAHVVREHGGAELLQRGPRKNTLL